MDLYARVPNRCMGDLTMDRSITEEKAIVPELRPNVIGRRRLEQLFRRVFKASLWWPMVTKKDPWRFDSPGVMHHRRTVGLDIPCQVARLQSLTPLLQAP